MGNHAYRALFLLLAGSVAVAGWLQTRFLVDDAFIAFRYVANAYDGHGFVWNTAPWQPVEGYTSYLWGAVLLLVWKVTGVAPPQSATTVAFLCGLASLWLVTRFLAADPWLMAPMRRRRLLVAVVLVGVASNHTWITWQSSGLDSGLFGMLAVGWTLCAASLREVLGGRELAKLAGWATAVQLARPDGTLMLAGTLAIAGLATLRRQLTVGRCLLALSPLSLVVAHFLWRRCFYGEWLPNTYYCKVIAPWPESGLRYLFCFALEHGVWLWGMLVAVWLLRSLAQPRAVLPALLARWPLTVAVGTWLTFVTYYSWRVGGDHFDYRPFMPLVPLLFVSCLFLPRKIGWGAWPTALVLLAFTGASNTLGWWHERLAVGRENEGFAALAPRVPAWLQPVMAVYDRERAWLRLHLVATPRPLLAAVCDRLRAAIPPRGTPVAGLVPGRRAIVEVGAAGVVGWALPQCDVFDPFGLNDWVVARNPELRGSERPPEQLLAELFNGLDTDRSGRLDAQELRQVVRFESLTPHALQPDTWAALLLAVAGPETSLDLAQWRHAIAHVVSSRQMTHDRQPPPGYREALRVCVELAAGQFRLKPDVPPITAEELRAVETEFRAKMQR